MIKNYKVIGLMSGTSIDGLDIAFCIFEKHNKKWNYKIEVAETINYSMEWKYKLLNSCKLSALDLLLLNNEFGYYLGKSVYDFILKHNIKPDLISSHGHTVFHQPANQLTYQIGNGECIAAICGLNVVFDFRTFDVALYGQGAPLVPIGDKLLFSEFDFCINLGGFANISYNLKNKRIAYDICPMNIVLNYLANYLGFDYDDNGEIASKGNLNEILFSQLENIEYYKLPFPKSLGKEWVLNQILPLFENSSISNKDKLRTFSEHVVSQLVKATSNKRKCKILFTGGGTFNKFIIDYFKTKTKHEVVIPNELIINYKEALIFAFLGVLRLRNEVNCLQSVTGALKNNIGGKIIIQ